MNKIKQIFKTLFILTIIVSSLKVYGYNLKYEATYSEETKTAEITTMTGAYPGTIRDYLAMTGNQYDVWINATAEDKESSGSEYTFGTPYYIFYSTKTDSIPTTYNSGFNTSGGNLSSNNIYYDTNNKNR